MVQRIFHFTFPSAFSAFCAVLSGCLLALAFPDFDYYFLAYAAFLPLFFAIEREHKNIYKSFVAGWIFAITFFFVSCIWLPNAPINYGGVPAPIAYFLLFCAVSFVGIFAGFFAMASAFMRSRIGATAYILFPLIWTATEFLRFQVTNNSWNSLGYSQYLNRGVHFLAPVGGVFMVGTLVVLNNVLIMFTAVAAYFAWQKVRSEEKISVPIYLLGREFQVLGLLVAALAALNVPGYFLKKAAIEMPTNVAVTAVQANVPMAGMTSDKFNHLLQRHIALADTGAASNNFPNKLIVFAESPMNFVYEEDREFRKLIGDLARRNASSVMLSSIEPDRETGGYFNSAVLVDKNGNKSGQYDKIFLVPLGESVPGPLVGIIPALAGAFIHGREYDLMNAGDAKFGVVICYEADFPNHARRLVADGAEFLVEMTNDGYLGNSGVLKQHLSNAVLRVLETERPMVRATNVGITAYITPDGEVKDTQPVYAEASHTWLVPKTDGGKTLYVQYGDWFSWLCVFVMFGSIAYVIKKR